MTNPPEPNNIYSLILVLLLSRRSARRVGHRMQEMFREAEGRGGEGDPIPRRQQARTVEEADVEVRSRWKVQGQVRRGGEEARHQSLKIDGHASQIPRSSTILT